MLSALAAPLLLGAAWLAPRLTDWTARRDGIALLAAGRLGLPVSLSGPVRLALLPSPMLEAEGVTVGGPDDALGFEARALRLRLDGWALLLGRLSPRELALVGADIRLPWPPAPGSSPPAALSSFEAEVVDGRLTLGTLPLERVRARLSAGGSADALRATGSFVPTTLWPGREVRFEATLGRSGEDGATPLGLSLSSGSAAVSAHGVLAASGRLEGGVEASGPDLSLLLPTPPGAFRTRGRLSATAELIVADDLALEFGGSPARGAATLRLRPAPRLDVALTTGRVELEPWIAGLRALGGLPGQAGGRLPFGLDLSAEAAGWRGLTLRRLRASVFREGDRLSLTDVSALLPGDTAVDLAGATAGAPGNERLETTLRFESSDLRTTLAALGWPLAGLAPDRLRQGAGRARLVLEDAQVALPELSATLDGTRLSGAGVLRFGARPALGLGLRLDALDLDGLWVMDRAPWEDWGVTSRDLALLDANLRVAVERMTLVGLAAERVGLDAALENGRLSVRQLAGRVAGADLSLSGAATLGPQPRLADLSLDLAAPDPRPLLALVPGSWPDSARIAAEPLTLRVFGGGAPDALALQAEADWAELRLESTVVASLPGRRAGGTLTLQHPGAPRLLSGAFGPGTGRWLGDGSLSLVLGFDADARALAAERFDLVAGGLRASGQLTLSLEGARPRLAGRVFAENLPLPLPTWRSTQPLPLDALRALNAEIAFAARRAGPWGVPMLEDAEGALRMEAGALRLDLARGRSSGGVVEGALGFDTSSPVPHLRLDGRIEGAEVTGPLTGLPLDLSSGRLDLSADLDARGSSAAALLATLSGEVSLGARDGVLTGLDARATRAAATGPGTEAALRPGLLGGATAFTELLLRARLAQGIAAISEAHLLTEGAALAAEGQADLGRSTLNARLSVLPAEIGTGEPGLGLRLAGPLERPQRLPELAAWLRWHADRGG